MVEQWDGYLLGPYDRVNAWLSNDEYIDFYAECEQNLDFVDELRKKWPERGDNPRH